MDENIKKLVQSYSLKDIVECIVNSYKIEDIIELIGEDEILDKIDDQTLFDQLEYSFILEDHDEDIYDEAYNKAKIDSKEYYENIIKQIKSFYEDENLSYDDKWKKTCQLINASSNYDSNDFFKKLNKFIEDLNKSTYKNENTRYSLIENLIT